MRNTFSYNFSVPKKLPGYVRNFQEEPFKLLLGNDDQCKIGASYLNNTEMSYICIDSSGKLWGEPRSKNKVKKLNTALVIPPIDKGESPFPIFEQISESNKTIDFVVFFEYAWHFMRTAVNDQEVKFPVIIISDISFANIHSILKFFMKMAIKEYLKMAYDHVVHNQRWTVPTTLGRIFKET